MLPEELGLLRRWDGFKNKVGLRIGTETGITLSPQEEKIGPLEKAQVLQVVLKN